MNLAEALKYCNRTLSENAGESPQIDSKVLVKAVLGCDDRYLYTYPEYQLTAEQSQDLKNKLARRVNGEPIAYITGFRDFWDFQLEVSPATLIPRPETEFLVETSLDKLTATEANVLDLGTGTGAIALALAKERPNWNVIGVDCVDGAVALALRNKTNLGLSNVDFKQSDWFQSVPDIRFDLIVSNPPYVEKDSPYVEQGDLRFEPLSALVADENGLADIRKIIDSAPDFLAMRGWLMIEHGYAQSEAVQSLLEQAGFFSISTVNDLQQLPRITLGQWNEK